MKAKISLAIVVFQLIVSILSADFILRPNVPTCTILVSSFDPIKVEVKIPNIASKVQGEHIALTVSSVKTNLIIKQLKIQDGKLFRQNFYLPPNVLHNLCLTFTTERDLDQNAFMFVGFKAQENFQSSLEQIKIPKDLMGKQNLQSIYQTGLRMKQFLSKSAERQRKERQVEDRVVDLSSHKTKRIVSMTLIECTVITLSGIYQIFALRRFLIDKNLY